MTTSEEEGEGGADVEVEEHVHSGTVSYPYSLDWREKGFVSPVRPTILHYENQELFTVLYIR